MEKIIIIGIGGHAKSVVDIIERQGIYQIAGYIAKEMIDVRHDLDYPIIGSDEDLEMIYNRGISNVAIGIGYMGRGDIRERLYDKLKKIGYSFPVICDPSAICSKKIEIGEGSFIGKGAIINSGTIIKHMCIINSGAVVEHDCVVREFSHISVRAVLCGAVHIGKSVMLGANATVIQGIEVGDRCIVGAGERLKYDISSNMKYVKDKIVVNKH